MNYYEILYIVSPALSEAEREELIKKLDDFVKEKGGEVLTENRWGTRTLAYPIKKHTTGYYVLTYVKLSGDKLKDLRYFMQINEGFLRAMIIKKDSVPSNLKKKEHSDAVETSSEKNVEANEETVKEQVPVAEVDSSEADEEE